MSRERTVIFVSPFFPPHVGGVESYVHGLATALHALPGWRAVVITTGRQNRSTTTETTDGMRVYTLPTLATVSYTPIDPRWPTQIRRIIRAERPDYVNVHTPVPGLADAATLAARDIPVVVTYHAAGLTKTGHPAFNALARTYTLAESLMMRRARLILGVSDYVADLLRSRYPGKVGVLENAVDESVLPPTLPGNAPTYTAAFMARLDPTHAWKGLDQLLHAFRAYATQFDPAARLLVIGDGAARPHYETLTRELAISRNVTFAGSLGGEDKFTALRSAQAFVLCPTSANDAFPTVMLEAWASGVPVIATAIGPLASLVEHRTTGLLVPPHQPQELATALRIVTTSPDLAARLRAISHTRVRDNYTWQRRATQFTAILEALAQRPLAHSSR